MLVRRPSSPFAPLLEMRERFDQLFEDLTDGQAAERRPAMDIIDEEDSLLIRAELPGLQADEVQVEVKDNVLMIRGEHEETKEEKDKRYIRRERRAASFARSISLPPGCDVDKIDASLHDGVLEIRIPQSQQEQPKAIVVKAAS